MRRNDGRVRAGTANLGVEHISRIHLLQNQDVHRLEVGRSSDGDLPVMGTSL